MLPCAGQKSTVPNNMWHVWFISTYVDRLPNTGLTCNNPGSKVTYQWKIRSAKQNVLYHNHRNLFRIFSQCRLPTTVTSHLPHVSPAKGAMGKSCHQSHVANEWCLWLCFSKDPHKPQMGSH